MDISKANRGDLELALYKLAQDLNLKIKAHTEAQAKFDFLDDQRKILFANIVSRYQGSEAEKTRQALVDSDWDYWNNDFALAKESLTKAKGERDALEIKWETCKQIIISRTKNT
jgi:hypothetical protein